MCSSSRPSDADLARLAGRLRVLTVRELVTAGLTPEAIEYRVRQGRLQWLWTGVYLVGPGPAHPLSLAQGATKSCTQAAWVSHYWTAYVLGFGPVPALPVDVTVKSGSRRGRRGKVLVHLSRLLEPRDVIVSRHGIPTVTAAHAILQIAATATLTEVDALISDAQVAKVLTEPQLHDVIDRAGRHRGAAKVRRVLTETPGLTRSEAERILRRLLKQAGLPQPVTDFLIGRYRADFAWPSHKLIVEFDGFGTHGHRQAFSPDRKRGAHLTAQGWSVMRITWDRLQDEPLAVVADIAGALAVREAAA